MNCQHELRESCRSSESFSEKATRIESFTSDKQKNAKQPKTHYIHSHTKNALNTLLRRNDAATRCPTELSHQSVCCVLFFGQLLLVDTSNHDFVFYANAVFQILN